MGNGSAIKKICLVTTSHISSNPRLVKEAYACSSAGYKVHIIFAQYLPELVAHDRIILGANPGWGCDIFDFTGEGLRASIIKKLLLSLNGLIRHLPSGFGFIKRRFNPIYEWQVRKAVAAQAGLYIGHNPGALSVVVEAARRTGAKSGFDAEDFHRNDMSDDPNDRDVIIKTALEDAFLPLLDHFTTASPMITGQYQQLYGRKAVTLLNVFSKKSVSGRTHAPNSPLKLFWFSQTIGPGRGLEQIIRAISLIDIEVELHLLGCVSDLYKDTLYQLCKEWSTNLYFYPRVLPEDIWQMATRFDIGVAAECPHPLNRDICLTNKLFTYIQSGLAIVASRTKAQQWLLDCYPMAGRLYSDETELGEILSQWHNKRETLHAVQAANFKLGQDVLNWDIESVKLIEQLQRLEHHV
jgi:hypothetical protein